MSDFDYAVYCCDLAMCLVDDPADMPDSVTVEELFNGCFSCPDNE